MNEEYSVSKVDFAISADFKLKHSSDIASSSIWLNISYFFLQDFMGKLRLQDFSVKNGWATYYL